MILVSEGVFLRTYFEFQQVLTERLLVSSLKSKSSIIRTFEGQTLEESIIRRGSNVFGGGWIDLPKQFFIFIRLIEGIGLSWGEEVLIRSIVLIGLGLYLKVTLRLDLKWRGGDEDLIFHLFLKISIRAFVGLSLEVGGLGSTNQVWVNIVLTSWISEAFLSGKHVVSIKNLLCWTILPGFKESSVFFVVNKVAVDRFARWFAQN